MLEPRRIASFALLFVLSYGVLMGVRTWVDDAYATWFRAFGNVVFTRYWFWGDGSVGFMDLRSPDYRERLEEKYRQRIAAPMRQQVKQNLRQRLGRPPAPEEMEEAYRRNVNDAITQVRMRYAVEKAEGVKDTLMVLWNDSTPGSFGGLKTSSRMMGYAPTVVIIALFVATPTTWRRRGWGLLWGLLLVHLFIAVRLSLPIAKDGFAAEKAYALFHPSDFWFGVLERVKTVVVDNPTAYLAVCVIIWLLICFLNGSLSAFRPQPGPDDRDRSEKSAEVRPRKR